MTAEITIEELEAVIKRRVNPEGFWRRIKESRENLSPTERIELSITECAALEMRGDFAAALKRAEETFARAQQIGYAQGMIGARAFVAYMHLRFGNYVESARLAKEALSYNETGSYAVFAFRSLAISDYNTGDWTNAQICFDRAINLSQQIGDRWGLFASLIDSCLLYEGKGQFDLALETLAQVRELGQWVEEAQWAVPLHQVLIYLMTGNRALARQALDELAPFAKASAFIEATYRAELAWLALDEDDLAQAHTELERAHSLEIIQGNEIIALWFRLIYSRYYRLRGEPSNAKQWARDILNRAQQNNSHYFQAMALIERARVWWMLENLVSTEKDLLAAFEIAQKLGAEHLAAEASFLLAALRHQQKHPDADATWLDAARRIKIGGYAFILERERALAFPLVAHYSRSRDPAMRASAETMLSHLAQIAPLPLRVHGLGRFEVWQGRRIIPSGEWQKRRAGELFRFLLLQPHYTAARDLIFESLCPDQFAESAKIFLHHATSTLRHILEPELPDKFPSRYLIVEGEQVELRLPSGSRIDFQVFEEKLSTNPHESSRMNERISEDLRGLADEETLAHYQGDLFPLDRYADWATDARERFAELHRRALLASAQKKLAEGSPQAALDASRQILASDPWREDAALIAMQASIALNDRPGALRVYRDLEQHLQTDLQISPRADLQDLAASLRK